MKDFVNASQQDFEELDRMLSDGQLHIYRDRALPPCCTPRTVRIGFEKHPQEYVLLVDQGVQTTSDHRDLACWLEQGETRFACLEDMEEFFRSLGPLFGEGEPSAPPPAAQELSGPDAAAGPAPAPDPCGQPVVDMEKLRAIREEQSRPPMVWPEEIAQRLKQQVFGQNGAIDDLADAIVLNRMNKETKMLVALLLGPTATGKSETGRSLAEILSQVYGKNYGFLNVACSEFQEGHMIQRFLGAPPGYIGHGTTSTLLEPVRANPYHVILMDEIEKAHPKVLVALMEAMDTGLLGMADNSPPIDLRSCILLFTSNLAVDPQAYQEASDLERAEMCKDLFTRHCGRPEISRRIQDFLVFVPLSEEAQTKVIIKFARKALDNYDAELVQIDERLMADFLRCRTKYGAAELGGRVTRAIGKQLLRRREPDLIRGRRLRLTGSMEQMEFEVL